MLCQFEKLLYPRDAHAASAGSYMVAVYRPCEILRDSAGDILPSFKAVGYYLPVSDKLRYDGPVGIWQHSEKGKVDGITGNVDLDIGYKDFPTIIKGKGLNGYGKEKALTNPPALVSYDGISVEITVDGKKYSGKLNKA